MIRTPALAALLALTVTIPAHAAPAPSASDYVREAQSRIRLQAAPGAKPRFSDLRHYQAQDVVAVCGKVRVNRDETLPFAVLWRDDDPLDEALIMAPMLLGETPRSRPSLGAVIDDVEEVCGGAKAQDGTPAPPAPLPPDITDAQYRQASHAEIQARIADIPGASVVSSRLGRTAKGEVVVCGVARVRGQALPFSTHWRADERLDRGASMIAVLGDQTPAESPALKAFSDTARLACQQAKLKVPTLKR